MYQKFLLAVICLTACVTNVHAKSKVVETVEQTIDFQAGQTLKVAAINGRINIKTWSRNQIQMTATKTAKANTKAEAEELLEATIIEVQSVANGLKIATKHPSERYFKRGKNIEINYDLTIPQSVVLNLQTTNGEIDIESTEGPIDAKTTNGDIDIDHSEGNINARTTNGDIKIDNQIGNVGAKTTNGGIELQEIKGSVGARTTNGSIDIALSSSSPEDIEAQTISGSIDLVLPTHFKANLQVQTSNGNISTDFPITIQGKFSGKSIQGALNGGGDSDISLQTVNGNIKIEYP